MKKYFTKISDCNTQTRRKHDFVVPPMKTEFGKKVYYYHAIKMWNSLPLNIQELRSSIEFDYNMSNLIVRCRNDSNIYPSEDRIINKHSIRSINDSNLTLY